MAFNIIQWNIKKLLVNKPSLSTLCSQVSSEVACIQETWSNPNSKLNIPNYSLVSHTPRTTNKGGGVAILATKNTPITNLSFNTDLEACAAIFHSKFKDITIVSLYIPPNSDNTNLIDNLDNLLQTIPPPYIICADVNGHHPAWGSADENRRGRLIYDWYTNNNLCLLNDGTPTFETYRGSYTHIDITLISQSIMLDFDWSVYHDNLTSDHYPILIKSLKHQIDPIPHLPKFKFKNINWSKFQDGLSLPLAPFSNPDVVCKQVEEAMIHSAKTTIPQTKPTNKTRSDKFWWNKECSKALNMKKSAYRKYRSNLGNIALWINYRKLKAQLTYTLQKARKEAWNDYISSINKDTPSSEIWNKIRILRNKRTYKYIILKIENSFIHCPQQISEIFAK